MRIGHDKIIPISIRIICATNKNLRTLVKEGKFIEDLYYRLCVLQLHIPPFANVVRIFYYLLIILWLFMLQLYRLTPSLSNDFSSDLKQFEKDLIIKALTESNYNKTKASILLGMNRTTLWKKLRDYNIE